MKRALSAFLGSSMLWIAWPALAGQPALQRLADDLAQRLLAPLEAECPDSCALALRIGGDASILGREGRLAQELEQLLVHRLTSQLAVSRVEVLPERAVEASLESARAGGASWLVRCAVGTAGDRLTATADLTPLAMPYWDRLVDPAPRGARHHLFASVESDEEVRLLLGMERAPPALGSWHLEEVLYLPRRILDAGLGDLDGNPGGELVLLFEDGIEVMGLGGGRARRLASLDLGGVPLEGVRTRDPSGVLLVVDFNRDGRSEIFYKLFNRRWGELLVWNGVRLDPVRKLTRIPLCVVHLERRPTLLSALPEPGTNRLDPKLELADINATSGKTLVLPSSLVGLRCHQVADGPVEIRVVDAARALHRLDLDGRLTPVPARAETAAGTTRNDTGAALGLVDLDLDGVAEVILSDAAWPGEPDGVQVLTGGPGDGQVLWRSRDVIGSVVAVAGGDPTGQGKQQAVLVAVEPGGQASRVYLLGR